MLQLACKLVLIDGAVHEESRNSRDVLKGCTHRGVLNLRLVGATSAALQLVRRCLSLLGQVRRCRVLARGRCRCSLVILHHPCAVSERRSTSLPLKFLNAMCCL